jgi:hypothetical protein
MSTAQEKVAYHVDRRSKTGAHSSWWTGTVRSWRRYATDWLENFKTLLDFFAPRQSTSDTLT